MRNVLIKTLKSLGIQSDRTKNITKHVFWSFVYKGGHIIAMFLLVPLTIKFLDTENYGVWLTLSSFIAWFSFFDIGLGNGLRNKFAEAKSKGDIDLAKGYVSTAYFTIGTICLFFLFVSIIINFYTDWTKVFNTSKTLQNQLQKLMPIIFVCFSLQLTLKLITSIYMGNQNHSMQGKISFITSASSLFIVCLLTQTANSSLLLFGAVFSVFPVLLLLFLNVYGFSGEFKLYKPQWAYWKRKYFNDIFGLGMTFFLIQISVLIMFTSDNFIITQLFSPKEVVPYNIAYKYISISNMLFTIILTPYWSSITEAYAKGEIDWIKNAMRNLIKFSLGILCLIIVLVIVSPFAYKIWIGDLVDVPIDLTISMAVFFIIQIGYSPFNFFINGVGKLRLHMYTFVIGAIANIPLSFVLVKYFQLGVKGVIIATIVCVFPNVIFFPLQYVKLINNNAKGIWDK